MLTLIGVGLVLAGPAYADHNSMYVVCPDPITEGETAQMTVGRPNYKVEKLWAFTYHEQFTAGADDFVSYNGEKMTSSGDSDKVRIPVVTIEDDEPEHDETFAIGFWDGELFHGCEITIDDDDLPEVTNVVLSSRPVRGDTYRAGESIDVTLTLEEKVEVTGNPLVSLYVDGGDGDSGWRGAEYHSGSGTRMLVFRYRVAVHDRDVDGVSVSSAAVGDDDQPLSGFGGDGQIVVEGTDVPIDYRHGGVAGSEGHKVDGRPWVQKASVTSSVPDGWDAYRANQVIEITLQFNTEVVAEGDVYAGLQLGLDGWNWLTAYRQADYLRGSGTDALVFGYTVQPGDLDPKGIKVGASPPGNDFEGNGTIKAKGTDVKWYSRYNGTGHLARHKVDTVPPTVSSVGFESRPADGEAYRAGETIRVAVRFDERVRTSGDPRYTLEVGDAVRQAALQPREIGRTLVFEYVVQPGDSDADGVGIGANGFNLNAGGVHDGAGNAADLSHDVVVADPDQKVDATPSG